MARHAPVVRSSEPLKHEDLPDHENTVKEDEEECIDFKDTIDMDLSKYSGADAAVLSRWQDLWLLQDHYADFRDFYRDCSIDLLGFEPTPMQYDIADFCQKCGIFSMIQAQRSEAKTTIAGCYALWCIIHNPSTIVLVVSAAGDLALEISTWIIQILNNMPVLKCLRPDKNHATTRMSLAKYDIHHDLKGVNKSASISSVGITSSLQGKRAHLLIPDDCESGKNSMTQLMRDQLLQKTREFSAINTNGKILYLGTPQSTDSIYNTLPGRGYTIRIWPGRFPTDAELENYGDCLAPFVLDQLKADPSLQTGGGPLGDRGKPTDPGMLNELKLFDKETDNGPAYFNLQYMLDTALTDVDRFPLKTEHCMFFPLDFEEAPGKFLWGPQPINKLPGPVGCDLNLKLYSPLNVLTETFPYESRLLSLDPSGEGTKNNDECGYSVIFTVNGYYCGMEIGGIQNATSEQGKLFWASLIQKWGVNQVVAEKNFGGGMFTNFIKGVIVEHELKASVDEVWSSGQKEQRIIQSLDPVLNSHRLVLNQAIIQQDMDSVKGYPLVKRNNYRFLQQFSKLTRDRGSLQHDDRVESLAIGIRYLKDAITIDAGKRADSIKSDQMLAWMKNPRGITTNKPGMYNNAKNILSNVMQRFNR